MTGDDAVFFQVQTARSFRLSAGEPHHADTVAWVYWHGAKTTKNSENRAKIAERAGGQATHRSGVEIQAVWRFLGADWMAV